MPSLVVRAASAVRFRAGGPTRADRQLLGAEANWQSRPGTAIRSAATTSIFIGYLELRISTKVGLSALSRQGLIKNAAKNPTYLTPTVRDITIFECYNFSLNLNCCFRGRREWMKKGLTSFASSSAP